MRAMNKYPSFFVRISPAADPGGPGCSSMGSGSLAARRAMCGVDTSDATRNWPHPSFRVRGRPPLRPFSRAAAAFATLRARPPEAPSCAAIQPGEPKTP